MNVAEKTPFIPGPVMCARNFTLSSMSSGQPVMAEAILDWFRPMTIGVVTAEPQGSEDESQDGVVKERVRSVRTSGVIEPGEKEKLDILAGGERSWESSVLWTTPDFNVPTDSVIVLDTKRYRVTAKKDFTANGYVRYEIGEDYARTS